MCVLGAKHGKPNKVAVKKIPRTASEKLSKIRNELTTMKMSRHPNVVEYIASYKTDDEVWVRYFIRFLHVKQKTEPLHRL